MTAGMVFPSPTSAVHSHRSSAWRSFKSRRSRVRHRNSWFSNFFYILSPQDLAIVCATLVGLYLITGENAELVCDTFTTLPAAVYTYQLLANPKSTTPAYEAALCFWVLHGTLILFDHLLRKTAWYFLAKFLLMAAVSSHVMAKCKSGNKCIGAEDDPVAIKDKSTSSLSSLMPDSTEAMVRMKKSLLRKKTSSCINDSVPTTPKRRLGLKADSALGSLLLQQLCKPKNKPEQFSLRGQSPPRTPYFQSLSDNFTPEQQIEQINSDDIPMQEKSVSRSVQTMPVMKTLMPRKWCNDDGDTPALDPRQPRRSLFLHGESEIKEETAGETEFHSSLFTDETNRSTFASVTTTNDDAVRKVIYNEIRSHLARKGSIASGDIASVCKFSKAQKTVGRLEDSLNNSSFGYPLSALEREDLIVNVRKLIFRRPYDQKILTVMLANNSADKNIMWEIKTNAATRIFITPNRGILLKKSMVKLHINVCGEDNSETPHSALPFITKDRIAIDYMFLAAGQVDFKDSLFVERDANKMRKNLNITYK